MDIRKWLDETLPAEKPTYLHTAPIANSPRRPHGRENVPKRKRMPKRSRADSSLLETPPPRHKKTTRPRDLSSEGGTDKSVHSEDPSGVHSEPSRFSTSSERYARQPRRKTRPGRYKTSFKVADERGKHVHCSRKEGSKRTQRKSKREKYKKPGSGMGHAFHAQNVTGDRLTLKPREQLGLFNKGRTSTAVKGRGLPDLVFSEMRFLQKHDQQSSVPQRPELTKKRRETDHTHLKEGEISAYFTTVRPAVVEKDQNLPDRRRAHVNESSHNPVEKEQERHPVYDTVPPTIKAPDRASYLGFGSRGPRHESTSYVTWSESGRAHSNTPAHLHDAFKHRVKPSGRDHNGESGDGDGDSCRQVAPPTTSQLEGCHLKKRFKASSPDASRCAVSRSQSFPQHTSSPRRINAIDRTAKFQQVDHSESPSSMPPSLLAHVGLYHSRAGCLNNCEEKIPGSAYVSCTKQDSTRAQRRTGSEEEDVSAMAPSLSSDLHRTIQHCNETFQQTCRPSTAYHNYLARCEVSHSAPRAEKHAHLNIDLTTRQTPRVRFAGTESRRPGLANFAGPGMYERQAEIGQAPRPDLDEHVLAFYSLEEGNLDHDHNMSLEEESWEEMPGDTFAYGHGVGVVDGEDSGLYCDNDGFEAESGVQHVASGDSVVAAGFWRPNRLY